MNSINVLFFYNSERRFPFWLFLNSRWYLPVLLFFPVLTIIFSSLLSFIYINSAFPHNRNEFFLPLLLLFLFFPLYSRRRLPRFGLIHFSQYHFLHESPPRASTLALSAATMSYFGLVFLHDFLRYLPHLRFSVLTVSVSSFLCFVFSYFTLDKFFFSFYLTFFMDPFQSFPKFSQ